MLTGVQIRSARAALRWPAETLAKKTGFSSKTIRRLEQFDGVSRQSDRTIAKIRIVLELAGIEFIGTPDDAPGIRIHQR